MMRRNPLNPLTLAIVGTALLVGASFAGPPVKTAPKKVIAPDFNREVRPILANHCLKCHGPDEKIRIAGLRLDTYMGATAKLKSGKQAINPAKLEQSELLQRVTAHDYRQMPPSSANKPLSDVQKDILKRWVLSGATYEQHWSFVAPKQAPLPTVKNTKWARNPIDRFVLAQLEKSGLTPAPEADKYTLVRRLYLDLIGLPPTPEEADAFVKDTRPDAYDRMVDKLMASPRYGERWARRWLDLARYADTNGYEKDRPRSIWPYRDWVIKVLNADMPFDRFTIAQIAGDMLPNATLNDRIATGFHRNTMRNEEGGADPLEYRFHSMTDRVATTGTTWLGLTVGCAQCHTHKYDPIPHKEYYRLMAFLDNADEPPLDIPQPDIAKKRAEIESEVARREADLPNRFPYFQPLIWKVGAAPKATAVSGATVENLPDASIRLTGANPDKDSYTVSFDTTATDVIAVQIETLTDSTLGNGGPGRTPHGNFVLSEVKATVAPKDAPQQAKPVTFTRAEADFAQSGFPPSDAIDGKPDTGWAISGPGKWNVNRTLTLHLKEPVSLPVGSRWTFTLDQNFGTQHTIGKFRIRLAQKMVDSDPRPETEKRREKFMAAFDAWRKPLEEKAVRWTVIKPTKATSDVPVLRILPDASVLSTSDITKKDIYRVGYAGLPSGITAMRIEVLPHESLPRNGPGRVYYEGSEGDFFFNDLKVKADGQPVKMVRGLATFGDGNALVDSQLDSGWSTGGAPGKPNAAVVVFEKPLTAKALNLEMLFERYYASSLGRFRISVTTDPKAGQVALLPEVEEALATPEAQRTAAQKVQLERAFTQVAAELAGERQEIEKLRRSMPAFPTTLVFTERPADNPRATYIRNRGEFLQPTTKVSPGVLGVLNPLPKGVSANRLTFAKWLVSPENPLTARVTVNRHWSTLFGRGIVRTTDDFGYQGEPPTHPELLDWLAVEFIKQGWLQKRLLKLIVTSATYRQSSVTTPIKRQKDPENKLLSRAPRLRLEAELLRDTVLTASGLLSPKMYGPSVFPPQPPGITTEGAYGPLTWTVSTGEDRYRRGLYTFAKRTAPYAMFATFDAPSGEATCPRRDLSNTPLQALALLNDEAFVEAAQHLGKVIASRPGSVEEKAAYLFRRCVTRPPTKDELAALTAFYAAQKTRLTAKELDASRIAGMGDGDPIERAAWTTLARSLLNLDEAVVKR